MAKQASRVRGVYEHMKPVPTDWVGVPVDWKPVIPSGIWYIRYRDKQGKLHRERVGPRGKAVELYAKRRNEVVEGKFRPETANRRKSATVGQVIDGWLEYARANGKKTIRDEETRMRFWREHLSSRPAESVKPSEIETLKNKLKADGREAETVNHYLKTLRAAFNLAVGKGWIQSNPARADKRGMCGVRYEKPPRGRIRFLTRVEEEALMREIPEADRPFVQVAVNTGIRMTALRTLKWADVNLPAGVIRVEQNKGGQPYAVELNSVAMKALQDQRRIGPSTLYVFPRRSSEPKQDVSRWFTLRAQAAGLEGVTFHVLRHTFASRLVMAGVDLRTVQELMGHTSIQMTTRYSHLAPSHRKAAVEKLAEKGDKVDASITTSIIGVSDDPASQANSLK